MTQRRSWRVNHFLRSIGQSTIASTMRPITLSGVMKLTAAHQGEKPSLSRILELDHVIIAQSTPYKDNSIIKGHCPTPRFFGCPLLWANRASHRPIMQHQLVAAHVDEDLSIIGSAFLVELG